MILPKFQFLASKGTSTDDIILLSTRNPKFLQSSLKNNIIPTYGMLRTYFQSDEKMIHCIASFPVSFMEARLVKSVKMLADAGVSDSTIGYLLHTRVSVLLSASFRKQVDETKELGIDTSTVKFAIALRAKKTVPKSLWDAKVDVLKSWGWSKETMSQAYRRNPLCMLSSKDKINEVMKLWVNQLGWDPLALAKFPWLFGYSLKRKLIPRAFVLQYLLSRGLRNKNDELSNPFFIFEELFVKRFVECFPEERFQLLKIYHEKKGCS